MGLSMLLSGAVSLGQLVLLLVCSGAAPSPTQDASVSSYSGFVSSQNFIQASFMTDLALLNSFWYVTFRVHSDLTYVSFLSDSKMSAVLGQNLLK